MRFVAIGDGHKVPLEEQELRSFEVTGENGKEPQLNTKTKSFHKVNIEQRAAHS